MELLSATIPPRREPHSCTDCRPAEAGFSLAELLVALLIVSFVSLGILTALGRGIELNSASRDYTQVANLAKSHLETLHALPFNSAGLATGVTHAMQSPDSRFNISYVVAEFTLTAVASDPNAVLAGTATPGTGNIKRITLTVAASNRTAPGQRDVTVEAVKHVR